MDVRPQAPTFTARLPLDSFYFQRPPLWLLQDVAIVKYDLTVQHGRHDAGVERLPFKR
jgi:hypothetical protein